MDMIMLPNTERVLSNADLSSSPHSHTIVTQTSTSDSEEHSGMVPQEQELRLPPVQHKLETDVLRSGKYTLTSWDIISTTISVLMRLVAIWLNVRLACSYKLAGQYAYFAWTTVCIAVPMVVTTLIHANMCYQDGKFNRGFLRSVRTLILVFLSSFFFRYGMSLFYSVECKRAEMIGNKELQLKYYKLTLREESDVAFIRLFECFMETAPQKILQIVILLLQVNEASSTQIVAICSYFCSMAWCLAAYHRCIRFAQADKYNIAFQGLVAQLCWHFCISVSRTLCIALVVFISPLWTIVGCLSHALVLGFITFIIDRPKFATTAFFNLLFCLAMGVVYLYTYIPVRDAPTRRKYCLYYLLCSAENITCVIVFLHFVISDSLTLSLLFYPLCGVAIMFYCIGIGFMAIYYLRYHPRITARKSKRIITNN